MYAPALLRRFADHHVKPHQTHSSTFAKIKAESIQDAQQGKKKADANNERQVSSHLIALISAKCVAVEN